MHSPNILIYGANGFAARLLSKQLRAENLPHVLAGRSKSVKAQAKHYGLESRVFRPDEAWDQLEGIDIVVNMAAPFRFTQEPLITNCIKQGTHYLDIAGDYEEMLRAFAFHDLAVEAGIKVIPGAGFGVVPTDIAAKLAVSQIADAHELDVVFRTIGRASRGSVYATLKDIDKYGVELTKGKYVQASPAQSTKQVELFSDSIEALYNPWRADLFTAPRSTGVQNVRTYSQFPRYAKHFMNGRSKWLRHLILKHLIKHLPEGPSEKDMLNGATLIQTTAKNERGDQSVVSIKGPEAYAFTALAVRKMIELCFKDSTKAGVLTPSMLGTEWILNDPEIQVEIN